jgi:hypothetical protein
MPKQEADAAAPDAAAPDAALSWPVTVKLEHPIEFGSERIESLTFQRGQIGFLKGIKIDGVPLTEQLLLIASRLCGKPVAALERIDPDDSGEVIELAMSFFARCLGAGKKP